MTAKFFFSKPFGGGGEERRRVGEAAKVGEARGGAGEEGRTKDLLAVKGGKKGKRKAAQPRSMTNNNSKRDAGNEEGLGGTCLRLGGYLVPFRIRLEYKMCLAREGILSKSGTSSNLLVGVCTRGRSERSFRVEIFGGLVDLVEMKEGE